MDHRFIDKNVRGGIPGTAINADWLHSVEEEPVSFATMGSGEFIYGKEDQAKNSVIAYPDHIFFGRVKEYPLEISIAGSSGSRDPAVEERIGYAENTGSDTVEVCRQDRREKTMISRSGKQV